MLQSCSSRVLYAAIFFAATAFFSVTSPARADCGMHAFVSRDVPLLRKMEAMPLKGTDVMRNKFTYGKMYVLLADPLYCSDEPLVRNQLAVSLKVLWENALFARAEVAALHYMKSGRTNAPRACFNNERLKVRANFVSQMSNKYSSSLAKMLKASPYYPHISALWREAMSSVGVPYPGIAILKDEYAWAYTYQQAAKISSEHLPDGVTCSDSPTNYSLR